MDFLCSAEKEVLLLLFRLDQVTDWLVRLKSYSHTFFEQQFPFIDPCKVPGSVNI